MVKGKPVFSLQLASYARDLWVTSWRRCRRGHLQSALTSPTTAAALARAADTYEINGKKGGKGRIKKQVRFTSPRTTRLTWVRIGAHPCPRPTKPPFKFTGTLKKVTVEGK